MASTICRVTSLVVIFTFALSEFGWSLSIFLKAGPFDRMKDPDLNVNCMADGPTYRDKIIVMTRITRQKLNESVVSIAFHSSDPRMGPYSRDYMKAEGDIDNGEHKSYLNLTIHRPSIQDGGVYRCQMLILDEHHNIIQNDVTTNVTFKEHAITDMFSPLMKAVWELREQIVAFKDILIQQNERMEYVKEESTKARNTHTTVNATIMGFHRDKQQQIKKLKFKLECLERKWIPYDEDNTCLKPFGQHEKSEHLTWDEARTECQKFGADLVQIHDKHKNTFVASMFNGTPFLNTWIGVKRHFMIADQYTYLDWIPVGFQPWADGQSPKPSDDKDQNECVGLLAKDSVNYGKWYRDRCSEVKRPFVCSISPNGCPDAGWAYYKPDQTCMKVFGSINEGIHPRPWSNATDKCLEFGGHLVVIRDRHKNNFVYDLASSVISENVWLGIRREPEYSPNFKYVDGSGLENDFQPWAKSENDTEPKNPNCVSMKIMLNDRAWWKETCSVAMQYVCSVAAGV